MKKVDLLFRFWSELTALSKLQCPSAQLLECLPWLMWTLKCIKGRDCEFLNINPGEAWFRFFFPFLLPSSLLSAYLSV